MRLRAKWVVDRRLEVRSDQIIDTGAPGGDLDFGNAILMPGLINSHCHLDYTDMKGRLVEKGPFPDWIRQLVELKQSWNESDFISSISNGCRESIRSGTTGLINWICQPDWISTSEPFPHRVWWMWEQMSITGLSGKSAWSEWEQRGQLSGDTFHTGMAPHSLYTCDEGALKQMLSWCGERAIPLSIHLAESREEFEMYQSSSGGLKTMLQERKVMNDDKGGGTPLSIFDRIASPLLPKSTRLILQLVHMNTMESTDWEKLSKWNENEKVRLSVVHCPGSHQQLGHPPFLLEEFRRRGIRVTLGTDSLASTSSLSLFHEFNTMRKRYPKLSAHDLLAMVTLDAAWAMGFEREWCDWQDWIVIPGCSAADEVLETIVNFTGRPEWIMIGGRVVDLKTLFHRY